MAVFHIALHSHNLAESKAFYTKVFGAEIGREYDEYIVFNLLGHQVVLHTGLVKIEGTLELKEGKEPPHFGIILDNRKEFDTLYKRCKDMSLHFFQDLFERYPDKKGWHFSFFVWDPSQNLIELKYYVNPSDVF